jgi:hypothetical protein
MDSRQFQIDVHDKYTHLYNSAVIGTSSDPATRLPVEELMHTFSSLPGCEEAYLNKLKQR